MKNLPLLLALGAGYFFYSKSKENKSTLSPIKKSYFLDKNCRFVITDREQALKWACEQGKTLKDFGEDFKTLLFEDCKKGQVKLDTKESILFFYDLICNVIFGYIISHKNKIEDLYKGYVRIYQLYFTALGQLVNLKIKFEPNELRKAGSFSIFKSLINERGYVINNCELLISNENKFINFGKNISKNITDFLDEDDNAEKEFAFYLSLITDACGQPKLNDKTEYLLSYTFLKGQLENEQVTPEDAKKSLLEVLKQFEKDNIDTTNWPKDL